jgi:hypothetical protein
VLLSRHPAACAAVCFPEGTAVCLHESTAVCLRDSTVLCLLRSLCLIALAVATHAAFASTHYYRTAQSLAVLLQ